MIQVTDSNSAVASSASVMINKLITITIYNTHACSGLHV